MYMMALAAHFQCAQLTQNAKCEGLFVFSVPKVVEQFAVENKGECIQLEATWKALIGRDTNGDIDRYVIKSFTQGVSTLFPFKI